MLTIEQLEDNLRKEGEIRCPRCGELQPNDDAQYPVSYHGSEDGPEEFVCSRCDWAFYVKEYVRRHYEISSDREEL